MPCNTSSFTFSINRHVGKISVFVSFLTFVILLDSTYTVRICAPNYNPNPAAHACIIAEKILIRCFRHSWIAVLFFAHLVESFKIPLVCLSSCAYDPVLKQKTSFLRISHKVFCGQVRQLNGCRFDNMFKGWG